MLKNKYPYIIAEIGCNHNGDVELAKKMIKQAKKCGCDAIKLQLWKREDLFTENYLHALNNGKVKLENVKEWKSEKMNLKNIFEQIKKFAIQETEHIELFRYAKNIGIDYGSTAITKEGIDFLIEQNVSFLKVAAMDVDNLDFIEYIVSKNIPTLISLGLASLAEIENVVDIIPEKHKHNITLLHCISLYPPRDEIVNLNFIGTLCRNFDFNIGYSDHTIGFTIPLIAIALGASVIEKHFTLDKNMIGWDQKVSADPDEFKIICNESKRIINALGTGMKEITKEELEKRSKLRRSLVTKHNIKKGEKLRKEDVVLKRPGTGIRPDEIKYALGRKLKHDIEKDHTLFWDDLE